MTKISLAKKFYQCGMERDEAIAKGANALEWDELEAKYKGASIPVHELYGLPYKAPYSCEYHSGGSAGAALRKLCKELKKALDESSPTE